MATQTDIRVMVPRVRRALEGAGAPETLTDNAVKDCIADACADVILYTGSLFGKALEVTHVDGVTGAPDEYATSDALALSEQSVVAAQAALTFFFHAFHGLKVQERIADEASSWEYQLSASLLVAQLKQLQAERDKALEAIEGQLAAGFDAYLSFLAERDRATSRMVEPWVYGVDDSGGLGGYGGQQLDTRFG